MQNRSEIFGDGPVHVFFCHFGGPENAEEVGPFLKELFEDPLIIRAPLGSFFRRQLAKRIVAKRVAESTEQYEAIGFSPINHYTRVQADHLDKRLKRINPKAQVHVVNRYTPPWAKEVIASLKLEGSRVFVISLYPHFCHSTSASSLRDVDQALMQECGDLAMDITHIYSWWHNEKYLELTWKNLCSTLEKAVKEAEDQVGILFSAHGIPRRYAEKGDPYSHEIKAHFEYLRRRGEKWLSEHAPQKTVTWELSFQSRVGKLEWLKPYTEDSIERLGGEGKKLLLMVPISFVSDHIETLYEMDVTYKKLALDAGFSSYLRVPGINEDEALAECLEDVLIKHGF